MRDRGTGRISARQIAQLGLFTALAVLMGYVESLIPLPVPVPGVRIGLANLIVVSVLWLYGVRSAVFVSLLRVLLCGFLFGTGVSILYSLAGAALSLAVMALLLKPGRFSPAGLSCAGGAAHMTGQLLCAVALLRDTAVLYYLPVLFICGTLTGFLIGWASALLLRRFAKSSLFE